MEPYDAFISYSHRKDKPIAQALQSVVQSIGKPWWGRRALRIFRDDSSLAATPHLWPDIAAALDRSRHLVLLASPEAAASHWVNKEVEHFLARKGPAGMLIALTAGRLVWNEPARTFEMGDGFPLPPALSGRFEAEPKWVDLTAYREGGSRASKRNPDFLTRAADLAAAIHGVPKEDLLSDELRQQRRALATAWGAAACLAALGLVSVWQTGQAKRERERVELVLAEGTRTANNLVLDLSQRFSGQKGIPKQFVVDVLGEAQSLVSQLAKSGGERPELMEAQATALLELSKAMRSQGNLDAALEHGRAASGLFERLAALPDAKADWGVGLAASHDRQGDALLGLDRPEDALAAYQESSRLSQKQADVGVPVASQNLAVSFEKIGQAHLARKRLDEARSAFETSIAMRKVAAAAEPQRVDRVRALAVAHANIAAAHLAAGHAAEAAMQERERLAISERLARAAPENYELQHDLGLAYRGLAAALAASGKTEEAREFFEKDLAIASTIAASDPDRIDWQIDVIAASDRLGDLLLEASSAEEALALFRKSLALAQRAGGLEPTRSDLKHALALAHRKVGHALKGLARLDEAIAAYRACLAVRTSVPAGEIRMEGWNETLEVDYQLLSEALVEAGRGEDALAVAEERALHFGDKDGDSRAEAAEAEIRALGGVAWFALFAKRYERTVEAVAAARALGADEPSLGINEAHANMLLGRDEEARAIYAAVKAGGASGAGNNIGEIVREDFAALRKAGISVPLMAEIEGQMAR